LISPQLIAAAAASMPATAACNVIIMRKWWLSAAGTSQRDLISPSASMPIANAGSSAAASNDSKAQIEVERERSKKSQALSDRDFSSDGCYRRGVSPIGVTIDADNDDTGEPCGTGTGATLRQAGSRWPAQGSTGPRR
jgi:hypothetical protein